jgi:predicted Zn-dependent peptidase
VRIVHRPGSVQSELRVGHPGLPRRIPDYHAVAVMSAILGGLFNSRLNMKLREEKGYTYGAGASFDLRRFAGPFTARAAVNTDATAPALADLVAELRRMRDELPTDAELRAARDYLVGVFPLRFETPGPVVSAVGGLVTYELPDDELDRYRPAVEAVTGEDVLAAARAHLDLEHLGVVVVGDADAVAADVEALGIGDVEVVREEDTAAGPA